MKIKWFHNAFFLSETGTYLYIEASYPQQKGYSARILSPLVTSDKVYGKSRCFQFWYHMFGPHIDSLNIYRKSGGSMVKLWTRVGDNGNIWRFGQVDLVSQLDYQVKCFLLLCVRENASECWIFLL